MLVRFWAPTGVFRVLTRRGVVGPQPGKSIPMISTAWTTGGEDRASVMRGAWSGSIWEIKLRISVPQSYKLPFAFVGCFRRRELTLPFPLHVLHDAGICLPPKPTNRAPELPAGGQGYRDRLMWVVWWFGCREGFGLWRDLDPSLVCFWELVVVGLLPGGGRRPVVDYINLWFIEPMPTPRILRIPIPRQCQQALLTTKQSPSTTRSALTMRPTSATYQYFATQHWRFDKRLTYIGVGLRILLNYHQFFLKNTGITARAPPFLKSRLIYSRCFLETDLKRNRVTVHLGRNSRRNPRNRALDTIGWRLIIQSALIKIGWSVERPDLGRSSGFTARRRHEKN